jgi:hypothetical protein
METWTPEDGGIKIPLLQIMYGVNEGALLSIETRVVSKLDPSVSLPDSLFQPPPGLKPSHYPILE